MWDDNKECYIAWQDINGKKYNHWHTFINFYASNIGMVPQERQRLMLKSFLSHPNSHLTFAAGLNLDDIDDGSLVADLKFGELINGTVFLGPAAEELVFRSAVGGASCAWTMINDLLKRWQQDKLCNTPLFVDWGSRHPFVFEKWHTLFTGSQSFSWLPQGNGNSGHEPYLSDGGAILWALYRGVLGIDANFKGFSINPRIPLEIGKVSVSIRLMGKKINVNYSNAGDKCEKIELDGRLINKDLIDWQEICNDSTVNVTICQG